MTKDAQIHVKAPGRLWAIVDPRTVEPDNKDDSNSPVHNVYIILKVGETLFATGFDIRPESTSKPTEVGQVTSHITR